MKILSFLMPSNLGADIPPLETVSCVNSCVYFLWFFLNWFHIVHEAVLYLSLKWCYFKENVLMRILNFIKISRRLNTNVPLFLFQFQNVRIFKLLGLNLEGFGLEGDVRFGKKNLFGVEVDSSSFGGADCWRFGLYFEVCWWMVIELN